VSAVVHVENASGDVACDVAGQERRSRADVVGRRQRRIGEPAIASIINSPEWAIPLAALVAIEGRREGVSRLADQKARLRKVGRLTIIRNSFFRGEA